VDRFGEIDGVGHCLCAIFRHQAESQRDDQIVHRAFHGRPGPEPGAIQGHVGGRHALGEPVAALAGVSDDFRCAENVASVLGLPLLPVVRSREAVAGAVVAVGYGWLLHRFTDAYAPFLDSVVLAFSVLAQLLLMRRHYESWWCWLLVNTIAVPLYLSKNLHVTALLYTAFWINAVVALVRWRKLIQA